MLKPKYKIGQVVRVQQYGRFDAGNIQRIWWDTDNHKQSVDGTWVYEIAVSSYESTIVREDDRSIELILLN